MFGEAAALGGLTVQLCYFRGFGDFFASDWQSSADSVLGIMQGLRCEAGRTQIGAVLQHAMRENLVKPLSCVVYVGDCLEEDIDVLADLAGKLGLLKVPLFVFQEGRDAIATAGFKDLCRLFLLILFLLIVFLSIVFLLILFLLIVFLFIVFLFIVFLLMVFLLIVFRARYCRSSFVWHTRFWPFSSYGYVAMAY